MGRVGKVMAKLAWVTLLMGRVCMGDIGAICGGTKSHKTRKRIVKEGEGYGLFQNLTKEQST